MVQPFAQVSSGTALGVAGIVVAVVALALPFWFGALLGPGGAALGYLAAQRGDRTLGRVAMICGAVVLVLSILTGAYVLGSG
jgi:hypothetical protein